MNAQGLVVENSKQVMTEMAGLALVLDQGGVVYVPDEATLLVADLHFEKASSLARRGIYLPPYDTIETLNKLAVLIERYKPKTIICMGDSFHDRSGHERLGLTLTEAVSRLAFGRDWVWISGNHDPDGKGELPGNVLMEHQLQNIVLRHEPKFLNGEFEIAGHLHPCARIEQRGRSLRRRCFALNGNHMVLPAFGALTGSLNVLDKAFMGMMAVAPATAIMLGQSGAYPINASRLLPD